MRGYAKTALVSILMMGLLAVPNLSPAKDGDGKHHLLNADLRAKIEHLRDKTAEHREDHHNQGGIPGSLQALQTEVANLKTVLAGMVNNEASLLSQLNAANTQLSSLATDLNILKKNGTGGSSVDPVLVELAKYVTVVPDMVSGLQGPHVIFRGVNVHVQSGAGTTDEIDPVTGLIRAGGLTGLGNFIVGYNERQFTEARKGSHNLVVGPFHTFTSTGGTVFGKSNWILGQSATVLGGVDNRSRSFASSILGGNGNSVFSPETTFPTFP